MLIFIKPKVEKSIYSSVFTLTICLPLFYLIKWKIRVNCLLYINLLVFSDRPAGAEPHDPGGEGGVQSEEDREHGLVKRR